jgi:hypothetical protein
VSLNGSDMLRRNQFAWRAWVRPVGLPVALALAEWEWKRERSVVKSAAIAAGALAGTYLVAQLDYEARRGVIGGRRALSA